MRRRTRKGGGRQVEVEIEHLGGRGDGVARLEGRPLFVPLAVPGDRLVARVVAETSGGLRGEAAELLAGGIFLVGVVITGALIVRRSRPDAILTRHVTPLQVHEGDRARVEISLS